MVRVGEDGPAQVSGQDGAEARPWLAGIGPLAVGILAIGAVIGAAAHAGVRLSDRGPLAEQRGPLLATGLLLLLLDVLVIVAIRRALLRRRRRPVVVEGLPRVMDDAPEPWWARLIFYLAVLVLIGLPVLLLYLAFRKRAADSEGEEPPPIEVPNVEIPEETLSSSMMSLLVLFSLAVIVIALILTYLQARPDRQVVPLVGEAAEPDLDEEALVSVVAAGQAAIHGAADPRAAIIMCYAAMEATLAEHGARRRVADTPTELLDRAAAAGLVRSDACRRLADLFGRARFSTHVMTRADVDAAAGALARLRADLGTSV